MQCHRYLRPLSFLLLLIAAPGLVSAQVLSLSFAEVAQTADLIFIGTVDTQTSRLNDQKTMIFTDVVFKDTVVISATDRSMQRNAFNIRLTYAGGAVGDVRISVSETPALVTGNRYLIFMVDDGQTYASPIIGGYQGLFEIIKDSESSAEYLRSVSGKAIVGLDTSGIRLSESPIAAIRAGTLIAAPNSNSPASQRRVQPAVPADAASSTDTVFKEDSGPEQPLKLPEFIKRLTNVTLRQPLENRAIKRTGTGFFYHNNGSKVQAEALRTSKPPVRLISVPDESGQAVIHTDVPLANPGSGPVAQRTPDSLESLTGGQLGACGFHHLDLVMEQVPTSWWEWQVANDSMYVWNQAMDIYRYVPDDGTWGDNSSNEFAGYPSNADVNNQYGFGWSPGAIAMCITTGSNSVTCGEIAQSDVCWNPAYSWTDDFNTALNGTPILLRPVNMHELGHSWGEQRGTYPETYDYDVISVMHSYYRGIIEDGWGLHSSDAYLIRRIYDDQRGINSSIRDVGVESYYASNGLHNATTNATTYTPGQSISLRNVTVENIGYSAVSDMRIRFFLSTNNIISTADYPLGSYWFWDSFCGECYNTGTYNTTIPSDIPPGTYYVGAIITINGFGNDDRTWNNSTYLYSRINVTCSGTFSMTPLSASFGAGGGPGSVSVNTPGSSCGWTAASSAPSWLSITSGSSGSGGGTVFYGVAANTTTSARSASISVSGAAHTINQTAGCLVSSATPITYRTTTSGSLTAADCLSQVRLVSDLYRPSADRYSFSATAGQQVAINQMSASFDTYVYLIDPGGAIIASDDDGGNGTNSRIPSSGGFITLPTTGTYTVEVTSFYVGVTGDYRLTVSAPYADVPTTHPFYDMINQLAAAGITQGCGGNNFCPDAPVTREQMAAFIIRVRGEFNPPPPTSQRFADVPPSNPFYAFIDRMAALGITSGCGGGNYCPSQPVTREQMAVFIIKALGEFNPPPPASQRFNDVPPQNLFYAFIDRMAVLQITSGCGNGKYCPADYATRGQMAVFLVRAFGL